MMDQAKLMKTKSKAPPPLTLFPPTIAQALSHLKERLQEDYEETYPGLGGVFRLVLDEEEARAWELTSFPHLLLPDLVEAHVAVLGLEPAQPRYQDILAPDMDHPLILAAAG
jgi:hypothetical protein